MFDFFKKKNPVSVRSDELCTSFAPMWRALIDIVNAAEQSPSTWREAGLYVGAMVLVELESRRGSDIAELRTEFVARWLIQVEMLTQDRGGLAAEQLTQLLLEQYPRYKRISEDADGSAQQLTRQLFARCLGEREKEDFSKTLPAAASVAKLTSGIREKARLVAGH